MHTETRVGMVVEGAAAGGGGGGGGGQILLNSGHSGVAVDGGAAHKFVAQQRALRHHQQSQIGTISQLLAGGVAGAVSKTSIILVAIIYYYSQPVGTKTWLRALLYCAVAPTILAGQIDPVLFEALYASQHAIFFFARIPQIWENYTNKSTGELSFLTSLMNFGGSMVRVFTSIQEKAPTSVVLGSVIGIVTNGTILSQIIIYQKPRGKKEKKNE